jgi:hypothetical protein
MATHKGALAALIKSRQTAERPGSDPAFMRFVWVASVSRLLAIRAGLMEPSGGRITGDGAAVVENGSTGKRRNGCRQAQGGKSGKDQVFHRNSPSATGGMSGFDGWVSGQYASDDNAASQHWTYAPKAEVSNRQP